MIVGEVDDFCAAGDGLDILLAELSEESIDVIFKFVPLHFDHPTANRLAFPSLLIALVFSRLLLLLGGLLVLFFLLVFLGGVVFHPEMSLVGLLVGEELGAFLAAL